MNNRQLVDFSIGDKRAVQNSGDSTRIDFWNGISVGSLPERITLKVGTQQNPNYQSNYYNADGTVWIYERPGWT
jgi:hypothetical protein